MNKFPKKKHTQVFLQKNCVQRVKKSSFRHSVRLLRRCLNFFFFQASPDATVPVSPFAPINSPPDCFLNAAHPLRVRIPPPNSIKNIPAAAEMLFFGPLGGMSMLCILRPRRPSLNATVPVSPFAPINSPPDCFLNAAHPLRVRIPPPNSIKNIPAAAEMLFFGPLGGIRTPDLQNRNLLRYPAAPRADIYETAERNVVGSAFFFIT